MSALENLYNDHNVNLDATVIGMATNLHEITQSLRSLFGYNDEQLGDAVSPAVVTLAYKLGDVTDDTTRVLTQKAISEMLGYKVRPRSRNAKSRVHVPNTANDKQIMVQILTDGNVRDDETREQAQERLNALAEQATGTEARYACFEIVKTLVGPWPSDSLSALNSQE